MVCLPCKFFVFSPHSTETAPNNKSPIHYVFRLFSYIIYVFCLLPSVRVLSTNLLLLRKNVWAFRKFLSRGLMCLELKREENIFRIFNEMRFLVVIKFLALLYFYVSKLLLPCGRLPARLFQVKVLLWGFRRHFGSHVHSTACKRYLMVELVVKVSGVWI